MPPEILPLGNTPRFCHDTVSSLLVLMRLHTRIGRLSPIVSLILRTGTGPRSTPPTTRIDTKVAVITRPAALEYDNPSPSTGLPISCLSDRLFLCPTDTIRPMLLHDILFLVAAITSITPLIASRGTYFDHGDRSHAVSPAWSGRDDSVKCILPDPANTITDRLNIALNSSGPGFVLRLCPNAHYMIQAPILFAAPDQEISTVGYPTDDSRATLVVSGPVANGTGHTNAVNGTCSNCSGVKLRNIQINGTRAGAPPNGGGANIEMGGPNSNQLIEYVRSYDPRSWSCLHITEGGLQCNNVIVQNNDIGPCGSDAYMQWADGISISCRSTVVRNNVVHGPTDGGIVLFGSPGSIVEHNIIRAIKHTLLGGINMVDVLPWGGNYSGTIVRNNTIIGGLATDSKSATQSHGTNVDDVIIKIGIAIGPQTWFGDAAFIGTNVSSSGTVLHNRFTGAFGYGIAMSSARNFTVEGNDLFGNISFIGIRGPNCSSSYPTPASAPFIVNLANVTSSTLQSNFQSVPYAKGLPCIQPPDDGNYWPYGGNLTPETIPHLNGVP